MRGARASPAARDTAAAGRPFTAAWIMLETRGSTEAGRSILELTNSSIFSLLRGRVSRTEHPGDAARRNLSRCSDYSFVVNGFKPSFSFPAQLRVLSGTTAASAVSVL